MDTQLSEFVQEAQSESPKIEAAVKNLISLLVSTRDVDMKDALAIAKSLLKAIHNTPLLTVDEYCLKYPQKNEQSGVDRLNEVCKLKTVIELRERVIAHQAKISKLFGRKYFAWTRCWPDIRSVVQADMKANASIAEETMEVFLIVFGASLTADQALSDDYSDLIWCADFAGGLAAHKKKRQEEVKQRLAAHEDANSEEEHAIVTEIEEKSE